MSDTQDFGFGQFVPGFDFLQNLAKGASDAMPQVPGLSNWIAPTLSVEELDKRISELRAVQFWLEQNGKALAATIQALEVQKMTLATLRNMDVTMTDLAEALKVKPQQTAAAQQAAEPAQATGATAGRTASPPVDPLQWWTALTGQFQQIAATAMQQSAQGARAADGTTGAVKSGGSATSGKTGKAGSASVEAGAASRPPVRKAAARKPASSTAAPRKSGAGGGGAAS